jgi:signal peptidase I
MFKSGTAYPPIPNNVFFEQVIACLNEGKNIVMYVQGNSMFPFICNGDKILLAPAESETLRLGDIVLAKTQIGVILHRVIELQENLIVLAGDGNTKQVEHASLDEVFGKVFIVYRGKLAWDASSFKSRLIWRCWHIFRPIRRVLLAFLKRLTKLTRTNDEDKR